MATDQHRASLAAAFERHAEEEGRILAEYRSLSEKLGEGAAGFLVNLILTEEEMHHLLLRTTAKWLRELPVRQEAAIAEGADREGLLRLTQELQSHEQETIAACRSLSGSLSGWEGEVLGSVLEVMTLDSEKHRKLLAVVEKIISA